MILMSAAGILIFVFARPIVTLFIDDAAVIDDAVSFMHVLALAQPLMAADSTLGGALRGAGDTRFPLVTVIAGSTGATRTRLAVRLRARLVAGLGVGGLARGLPAAWGLKAWRLHGGRWKQIRV